MNWKSQLISIASADGHDDGAHDLQHLHRVWRLAQALLAEYPQADAMIVQAACYLHDLVNVPKDHPDRAQASTLAAGLACAKLERIGFPSEKLAGVAHAIEAHSFSASIAPTTIEARIVQDADRLDALGAVGLARLFYTAGRMGSALAHPTDPLGAQRALDDRQFALDHIEVKLAKLPGSMQTAAARKIGAARLDQLRRFREDFVDEWS
ncbi:MAG: HD domain-containing protein [Burkholderiaceae bacterium]|nr:HD domain-containing protein [Burkholderiaceae bacterium]